MFSSGGFCFSSLRLIVASMRVGWRLVFGVTVVGIAAGGGFAGLGAQRIDQAGIAGRRSRGQVLATVNLRVQRIANVTLLPADAAVAACLRVRSGRSGGIGLPSSMVRAGNSRSLRAGCGRQVVQL